MRYRVSILPLVVVLLCTSCSSRVDLLPAEEFHWCAAGQTVSFCPPPADWERSRHQERDTGVSFIRRDVPPGWITVGEYLGVCKMDPRPKLRTLQARFDQFNPREFHQAVLDARRFQNSGFSEAGNRVIERVNESLTRAGIAYRRKDFGTAKQHVASAVQEGSRLEYRLEDLAAKYLFNTEGFRNPEMYDVQEPVSGVLCGVPSLTVDYTMDEERGLHVGRKVYAAWGSHLFVFSYLGPEKYLPVFEQMLVTVSFPMEDAPVVAE